MLQAQRDNVIVVPVYQKKVADLIHIPENAVKYKQYDGMVYGRVISVGPECKFELVPGDIMIWQRNEGIKIIYEGVEYLRVKPRAIYGKWDINKIGGDMIIQPLGDRILIKPIKAEEKTKGGIFIPDTVKEKPHEGEVIATGKGRVLENGDVEPLEVKVGDTVLHGKYSGTEITKDGQEYLFIKEEDVLAIFKE